MFRRRNSCIAWVAALHETWQFRDAPWCKAYIQSALPSKTSNVTVDSIGLLIVQVTMRPAILLFTALSAGALAHSTSPRTTSGSHAASTMNLFLGPSATPYGLVGSVVHTDKCGTTYALHCTSYHSPEARHTTIFGLCDPSYTVTATYGPSSYALYGVNSIFGGTGGVVTNVQTCSLDSTTEAICSVTKTIGTTKDAILTSQVVTLTGTNLLFGQIPITAGGEKLSNLAACTPTSSGGAAVATGISQAYKVIVVPGAAALLAGALL